MRGHDYLEEIRDDEVQGKIKAKATEQRAPNTSESYSNWLAFVGELFRSNKGLVANSLFTNPTTAGAQESMTNIDFLRKIYSLHHLSGDRQARPIKSDRQNKYLPVLGLLKDNPITDS